ncbi:MAG: hypothetical protein SFU98_18130 [Leptospiraceae bacterium]|nr:hypothetical protein [Leptospiraceae bacterium]
MKAIACLLILLINTACLKAKKSNFDLNKGGPFGLLFLINALTNNSTGNLSVSGTITGMSSGSITILNNTTEKIITSPETKFQFNGLKSGDAYSITIKQNPDGRICNVSNGTGKLSSNVTNVTIACNNFTSPTNVYPSQKNWNDYIKKDGTSILTATGTACDPNDTSIPNYFGCIAAWLVLKVDISGINSCTGITASDSELALNWRCQANASSVSLYSTYFNDGKGLSDLLDWTVTPDWKNLQLTVFKDGVTFAKTTPAKWWTQTIDNTQPFGALGAGNAGKILAYTNSSFSNLITLGNVNPKTSIIFNPNILVNVTGGGSLFISTSGGSHFNWFEGNIICNNCGSTININGSYNVFKKLKLKYSIPTTNTTFLTLNSSPQPGNNFVESVILADLTSSGGIYAAPIYIVNGTGNILKNIFTLNTGTTSPSNGDLLISAGSGTTVINYTSMNSAQMGLEMGTDGKFFNISVFNSSLEGIKCDNGAIQACAGNSFNNIATIGNLQSIHYSTSNNNLLTFQNIVNTGNTSGTSILLNSGNLNGRFTGVFKNSGNCTASTSTSGISNSSCQGGGLSDYNGNNTPITTPSVANSYVGYAVTDSKNTTSGLSGSFLAYGSITDFLRFENNYRGIGKYSNVSFPNINHQGRCSSGSCTIWDFSLKSSDTVLRNANLDTANGGTGCPTGNSTITHSFVGGGSVTFLRNTVEILGDGIGDDDGFCESNEECLLTPNVGSYQGHGELVSAEKVSGCKDITTGTISNVKLWQFATNGY